MREDTVEDDLKSMADWVSAAVAGLSVFSVLPNVLLCLTGVWTLTRLYEAFTGRKFSESWIARFITGRL